MEKLLFCPLGNPSGQQQRIQFCLFQIAWRLVKIQEALLHRPRPCPHFDSVRYNNNKNLIESVGDAWNGMRRCRGSPFETTNYWREGGREGKMGAGAVRRQRCFTNSSLILASFQIDGYELCDDVRILSSMDEFHQNHARGNIQAGNESLAALLQIKHGSLIFIYLFCVLSMILLLFAGKSIDKINNDNIWKAEDKSAEQEVGGA